jgi:hypothetical protein
MLRRGALAALAALPLAGCGVVARSRDAALPGRAPTGPAQWARTAWRYVENNTNYDTGLVGGVDHQAMFTTWNAADMLAAIVCAHELGVIGPREFEFRLSRVMGFLGAMDLSQGLLPNKAYNAATKKMVAFDGREDDIGWTAVDVGRLLVWLEIVARRYPLLAGYADRIVLRWNFCQVIDDCGELRGATRDKGQVYRYQEGRLGYEQLAAAGFALWGFDAHAAAQVPATQVARIDGLPVHYDARDPRTTGAQSPLTTMPFAFMGMELGWGGREGLRAIADEVHAVQEQRWRKEALWTARSDYQMRDAPYVVLDSVHASGYPWNTIAGDGKEYPNLALVSTRAAFGFWALWPDDYSRALVESMQWMHDPDRGWFEGRLESGGGPLAMITLSTNAAVLEALLFREKGVLCPAQPRAGYWHAQQRDAFARRNQCLPGERPACQSRQ